MLVNLSNHPFSEWKETQKTIAIAQFHNIVDISFPEIEPEAETNEIILFTKKYLKQCLDIFQGTDNNAIHISGEPCFVFHFVTLAKSHQIRCIHSTTRRIVENNKNIKTSVFQFVKFRNY